MKGTKRHKARRSPPPHKSGLTKAEEWSEGAEQGSKGWRGNYRQSHSSLVRFVCRTRWGFWDCQSARALPLFPLVRAVPYAWAEAFGVRQRQDLFYKKYCNTQRAFVMPVHPGFCFSLYYLRRKWCLIYSLLKFKRSLSFLLAMAVLVVAFFKSEETGESEEFIYFGHPEHLSHPPLLGTGPDPAKFLQSQTSIRWQPGFVSPCRNAVVMGNCDLGETNKPSEPSGSSSVCAVKACSEVVLLQKPEQRLAVGQWAPGRLELLPPVPQHLCTGSRSSRVLRRSLLPQPLHCSLTPFLLRVMFFLKCHKKHVIWMAWRNPVCPRASVFAVRELYQWQW